MKKFKQFVIHKYPELFSFFVVILFFLIYMICNNVAPFGQNVFSGGDTFHQLYSFLASFQNKLKNGESLVYSWNGALGGDFLPLYFYYLASPFNFLVAFISKESISSFISLGIAIKLAFSALFLCCYLSYRFKKSDNKIWFIFISCAYALSSFMCCYSYQILWVDSLMVFPLVMLGYDKLIKEGKPILYTLALTYCIFVNYYMAYMICIFLFLWFIFDNHGSIRSFLKHIVLFSSFSIISAGLSFLSLYISYIGIKKTVSVNEGFAKHFWYGNIFEVIRQMFIFPKAIYSSYTPNDTNIYCGLFTVLFVVLYIFVKEIKILEKVRRIILLAFLLISFNENVLNYIWHGFHTQHSVPNRFSFVFIFLMLLTASEIIYYLENLNARLLVLGCILTQCLPIISYFFVDYNSFLPSSQIIILSMSILFVYSLLIIILSMIKKYNAKKLIMTIICTVSLAELIVNAGVFLEPVVMDYSVINSLYTKIDSIKKEVEESDKEVFYRSDVVNGLSDNQNSYHDMNGLSVFNSEVNRNIPIFCQGIGYHTGMNRIMNLDSYEFIDDILGIKYIYTPRDNYNYSHKEVYSEVMGKDEISVYRNTHALSLGFGASNKISENYKLDNYDVSKNINTLASYLGAEDPIFSEIYPKYKIEAYECEISMGDSEFLSFMYETLNNSKYITASYEVEEDGEYYIYIDDKNEDRFIVMVDDTVVYDGIWITYGLQNLGSLKPGNTVKIIVTDNAEHQFQANKSQCEVKIRIYQENKKAVSDLYNKLAKNQMNITEFTNDHLSGEVCLDDGQVLFTSIPYDNGWHVYEDGKEIETIIIADTFLGIDAGKGNHTFTFKFIPEGLYVGLIITGLFWILFIAICILLHKGKLSFLMTDSSEDCSENDE